MSIINDRTTNKSFALPNIDNFLSDDIVRLREAISAIDAEFLTVYNAAVNDALAGSTPASHAGAGGAAHSNAVAGGAAGFMSGADKTKLDGAALAINLTKAGVGLANVDNTPDADKPVSTAQATAIGLKANLASPAMTGTPSAPTAAAGTNTTQLATAAHVFAERANVATLTNKTLTNPTNTEQTLTDAVTTAWDMNLGHVAIWAIGATGRTLAAPTNYKVGGQYQLMLGLTTPSTMTPTWPAIFKFPYDTAPDLTTSTWTVFTLVWSPPHSKFLVSYSPGF